MATKKNKPDCNAETSSMRHIFLSFARHDDEAFVKRLYNDLIKAGFTVWDDRKSKISNQLIFRQEIKDPIHTEEITIVVICRQLGASEEWASEQELEKEYGDVPIIPSFRLANIFSSLPNGVKTAAM